MSLIKFSIQTFILAALGAALTGCVPKATEKKAVCGVNQAFSPVTRSCYSISEVRYNPVATKSTESLQEEVSKTVELTYTDKNNNKALSCSVSGVSSNLEVISPHLINNNFMTMAQDIAVLASSMAELINTTAANNIKDDMNDALDVVKKSFYLQTLTSQIVIYKNNLDQIIAMAPNYQSSLTIQNYYKVIQQKLVEFDLVYDQVINRCACTAGICTTTLVPKMNKNGTAGFSYSISDSDGDSALKTVNVTISAMAKNTTHLLPVAQSGYVSFNESNTASTVPSNFNLLSSADLSGALASSMRYSFAGSSTVPYLSGTAGKTANGKIINCLGFYGSGSNDTSCTYIADDADAFNSTYDYARTTPAIDDVVYSAANGAAGNNITIQYFDLNDNNEGADPYITKTQTFGMISSSKEIFIRVFGNAIKVFLNPLVTTTADIVSAINAHPQAKLMVVASGGSSSTYPFMFPHSSAFTLSGGVDAFDTVPYKVTNAQGASSTNTASIMISMVSQNDAPRIPNEYPPAAPAAEVFPEKTVSRTITLAFRDPDNTVGSLSVFAAIDTLTGTCQSNMTTGGFGTFNAAGIGVSAPVVTSCASGDCTATVDITPPAIFNGLACLYYYAQDSSLLESPVQGVQINITPVNDLPTITNIADTAINEDLSPLPLPILDAYSPFTVSTGGGSFEANQLLRFEVTSSDPALIPERSCTNYKTTAGSPIVAGITPISSSEKYLDTTTFHCYEADGTTWKLYPSLTVYPVCGHTSEGYGTPTGTPSILGAKYLDKANNRCYIADTNSSSVLYWKKDPSVTQYNVAYIPEKDKSGTTRIQVKVIDDDLVSPGSAFDEFDVVVNSINDAPFLIEAKSSIETNEGGAVQSEGFLVDEDAGATAQENSQRIRISSITTDNTNVLPVSAIRIFYDLNDNGVEDTSEARAVGDFLDAAGAVDSSEHYFYLKLDPVDGVAGNANITLTLDDGSAVNGTTTKSLSFIVYPVAALHGGWNNISSVGLKTDKNGTPVSESEIQCNYNRKNSVVALSDERLCSGEDCVNDMAPHGTIVPDAKNVIYWDRQNKRCYRSTDSNEFSWVELNTSCPITRKANVCLDGDGKFNNCLHGGSPTAAAIVGKTHLPLTPSIVGQFVLDTQNTPSTSDDTCFVSTGTTDADWIPYTPSRITLSWKNFTMVGSGPESGVSIKGWNVYRREAGSDYNFRGGHLINTNSTTKMTNTSFSNREFVDTTAIAGKVYYYVVRPVDDRRELPTHTPEIFSEVRVLAAPENYSFVHRWMVNQEICNGMNLTTATSLGSIDQSNNFRCEYTGPGSVGGYFDYGKDLLVDTQEVGCPYAPAPRCGANGCVGIGTPPSPATSVATGVQNNDLYYSRSLGRCYRYLGGAWGELETTNTADGTFDDLILNSALNAPLVNITQARAVEICSRRPTPTNTDITFTATSARLPNKLDFNAFAAHKFDRTDSEIDAIEEGSSLDTNSRCNGSQASGLETGFTDSSIPSTSLIYTLPGTLSSGIRSIYTGSISWGQSKGTEACVSRYGIQDLYGNVAEWTVDQMVCSNPPEAYTSCAVDTAVPNTIFTANDFDTGLSYAFDTYTGPFNDIISAVRGPSAGDGHMSDWAFADENFGAGKFSYPMALPISETVSTSLPSYPWLLDIGPSSGITTNKLHGDAIIVNSSNLKGERASFAVGGSYLSGARSGRFTSELVKSNTYGPDLGFRCMIPIDSQSDYPADAAHDVYPY